MTTRVLTFLGLLAVFLFSAFLQRNNSVTTPAGEACTPMSLNANREGMECPYAGQVGNASSWRYDPAVVSRMGGFSLNPANFATPEAGRAIRDLWQWDINAMQSGQPYPALEEHDIYLLHSPVILRDANARTGVLIILAHAALDYGDTEKAVEYFHMLRADAVRDRNTPQVPAARISASKISEILVAQVTGGSSSTKESGPQRSKALRAINSWRASVESECVRDP